VKLLANDDHSTVHGLRASESKKNRILKAFCHHGQSDNLYLKGKFADIDSNIREQGGRTYLETGGEKVS